MIRMSPKLVWSLGVAITFCVVVQTLAFAEAKNKYVDVDVFVRSLSKAGIQAEYVGEIIGKAEAFGLSRPNGLFDALAIQVPNELSKCQYMLVSEIGAIFLERADWGHVYDLLLIRVGGGKFTSIEPKMDWGPLPCAPK